MLGYTGLPQGAFRGPLEPPLLPLRGAYFRGLEGPYYYGALRGPWLLGEGPQAPLIGGGPPNPPGG